MSSTPTVGMEIMLGIQPISIHIRIQSITTYKRLLANGNWLIDDGEILNKESHVIIMKRITRSLETLTLPRDKLLHTAYTPTKFKTEILPREQINAVKKKPKPSEPNTVNCFTDGSKFDGNDGVSRSGYGYLIWGENIRQNGFNYLGSLATVYQCELMAIQEAAFVMINNEVANKKIIFYVDNQAAIITLGNYLIKSNVALRTKQMVNILSNNNQVIISWIPGHSQHKGNEVADNLAKDGANFVQEGPKAIIPIADAVTTDEIRNLGTRMHQRFWESHPHCRQTKMMLPTAKNKLWREIIKQPRKMVNLITQLYTGHATLKRHLNLMAIEDDGRCNQCNEENTEETVQHYLAECPAFSRSRRNSLGYISLTTNELPNLTLTNILKFVKDTKRFEQNE
jgi:ribonuclease HI